MTTVFLIMGSVGIAALVLSILLGDLFHVDVADGVFSLPVVAGFVSALGFGGMIGSYLAPGSSSVRAFIGVGIGLLFAVPAAWLTWRLTRAAMHMPTDTTPDQDSLLGTIGVVVTPITAERPGEVRVLLAGQPVKLRARAETPMEQGTQVFVIEAESATTVLVEPTTPALPTS
ncbi:NfeD family protein [Stackebrandtia soli]|uniref:NfeD family protein n=1 Tax=Stackebrandtia soli TaxID=1892856 RepID=UPI0039E7ECA8